MIPFWCQKSILSRSTSSPSLHNIFPYVRSIYMYKHESAGNRSIFLTFVAAHLSKMCQFNNVVVYIYFHLQWRQRNSHFPIWCQKLHQRGRLFEVSIQLRRRRWICVCVLKECLNLEKIGLSLISSFIRTSSKAFSTSFSKNSLMIMEPSLSTFGSSLSLPTHYEMCNSNVILHSSGMGQSFWPSSELWNEWFSTQPTFPYINFCWVRRGCTS